MTAATRHRLTYPSITEFLDWVCLEYDGEDYLLSYRFPEEVHQVRVLDIHGPQIPSMTGALMPTPSIVAAVVLVNLCPLPQEWVSPTAKHLLAEHWAQSELLMVIDRRPRKSPEQEPTDG